MVRADASSPASDRRVALTPAGVRPAEKAFDPRVLERRIAAFWVKEDAYARTKAHRQGRGQPYYFLDGPPYATGHIHIGTARNKVLKDVFVRHMRMRGFDVRDQPGYDMHGLPIEVKVEKELGIRTKKEIESRGIDSFVEACRTFAMEHLRMMTGEFEELAIWMDWQKPYMTITNDYIEGAWWAIEQAHQRGLLFESERVLTWCWRCETALANAEIEFEDREDPSVYVKFPLADGSGSLVIWTTTPWTLPANMAIAANPDITYARVRVTKGGQSEVLVLAADNAEAVAKAGRYERHEVLGTMPGTALEGLRYRHPLAPDINIEWPASDWTHKVILGKHVAADRSGLVHTATGHGVEDFEAGKKYGIPVFSPVGEDGKYTSEAGPLEGLQVKSKETRSPADERVLALLAERGALLSQRNEKHSYGHCWRCKNPILFRATKQWFIDVPKIKDRMLAEVERVTWTPAWAGSARQKDWVEDARDWCISRQRYWGIPLPVWKCGHCGETTVIGSRRELHHVSDVRPDTDLHRPWIDKVRVVCPRRGCGGVMKRVPDVLDVWFDSAVASWATLGFPGQKKEFETLFPAKWICEGLDQTRGWFYSQLAAGVAAMDQVPYERVVMHGWVNDAQGRPMSKSLGNIVAPGEVVAQFGCDAFRMGLVGGAAPWEDVSFGTENVRNAQRTLNILWNVHVFATQYMAEDGFDPAKRVAPARPEDAWLLSRLQTTIAEATGHVETSEFHRALRTVEQFVLEDLSRWYVRLVRERVWDEAASADKNAAYSVLHLALLQTARLLAPFAPHVAEAIYQDLMDGRGHLSVHMEDWPVADGALTDYDLERDMATVRAAVDAAAYARQKANMKLRWPVASLVFASDDPEVLSALRRFEPMVLEQANTKGIDLKTGGWEKLDLAALPNKQFIGRTFKADGPRIMQALAAMPPHDVRAMRGAHAKGETWMVAGHALTAEAVTYETRLPAHTSGADFQGGSVYVDTVVTPELQAEGAARDLTRRIQEMRKALGLAMDATVHVQVAAPDDFRALVEPHLASVRDATRARHLAWSAKPAGALVKEWDLEGTTIAIGVGTEEPRLTPVGLERPTAPRARAKPKAPAPKKKAPAKKPKKAAPTKKAAGKKANPKAKKVVKKKAAAKKPKPKRGRR
jgi:isoleucyl-tRNA synthetase